MQTKIYAIRRKYGQGFEIVSLWASEKDAKRRVAELGKDTHRILEMWLNY